MLRQTSTPIPNPPISQGTLPPDTALAPVTTYDYIDNDTHALSESPNPSTGGKMRSKHTK